MHYVRLAFLALVPCLAAQDVTKPKDRFADEPERLKAESPVQFSHSWDEAQAEARRTGRRILAYFTGEHCG